MKFERQRRIFSFYISLVPCFVFGPLACAQDEPSYEVLYSRIAALEEQSKISKAWLWNACTYDAEKTSPSTESFNSCLNDLTTHLEQMSHFASGIAQQYCAPQGLRSRGVSSSQCLSDHLKTTDLDRDDFLDNISKSSAGEDNSSLHRRSTASIAEMQRNLLVQTAIGCEPEENPCVDDREALDIKDPWDKRVIMLVGRMMCRKSKGRYQRSTFTIVTTPRIDQVNPRDSVAIAAGHGFFDRDGREVKPCRFFMKTHKGKWVEVADLVKKDVRYRSRDLPFNVHDDDWAVMTIRFKKGIRLSDYVKPFTLQAYNGFELDKAMLAGSEISAGGYHREKNDLYVDRSCRAKQAASGFVYTNPKLAMHTCDTIAGSSGQLLLLDNERPFAIHSGSRPPRPGEDPENYRVGVEAWDFRKSANRAIFITHEMVAAAEDIVFTPRQRARYRPQRELERKRILLGRKQELERRKEELERRQRELSIAYQNLSAFSTSCKQNLLAQNYIEQLLQIPDDCWHYDHMRGAVIHDWVLDGHGDELTTDDFMAKEIPVLWRTTKDVVDLFHFFETRDQRLYSGMHGYLREQVEQLEQELEHNNSRHRGNKDSIAEMQRNLPVQKATGCGPEGISCVDDREALDIEDPWDKRVTMLVGRMMCRGQMSTFTIVTTPRIDQVNPRDSVAIAAGHALFDKDGRELKPCRFFMKTHKGSWVEAADLVKKDIRFRSRDLPLNLTDDDWAVMTIRFKNGIRLSDHVKPFTLQAYNGFELNKAMLAGSEVSAAGYRRTTDDLYIDRSCRAQQAAAGFVYTNPKLAMHSCDSAGGTAGQLLLLDNEKPFAIHSGSRSPRSGQNPESYHNGVEAWDFRKKANRAIFITHEMVAAAEDIVLNP